MIFAALLFVYQGKLGVAQTARGPHDGVENWPKLDRRALDGIQDITGSLLPLQSHGQFAP